MDATRTSNTLYFGFGSNLWLDQMHRRCPKSKFIGYALLADWKWIINDRGYANVIPSKSDVVYGLVYELTPDDEASLDGYEGVPHSYVKQILGVELTVVGEPNIGESKKAIKALVYVDVLRKTEGPPQKEYIYRMSKGIADGIKKGIPKEYFEKYLRPFIPEELGN